MVFLIRDWQNVREYPYGSQGGRDYIDDYLKINREEEGTEKFANFLKKLTAI